MELNWGNRTRLAAGAGGCLLAGAVVWWFGDASTDMWRAAFLRAGILLSSAWVAYPALRWRTGDRPWSAGGTLIGLVAAVMLGRLRVPLKWLIPSATVTAIALAILYPKGRDERAAASPKPHPSDTADR